MRLAERLYYGVSLGLGRLLRASRYSRVRVVREGCAVQVRKKRASYAPFLIWMSGPLMWVLDSGVRVLPWREWVERERELFERLYGASVRVDDDGTLVLPFLSRRTLAALLEDPAVDEPARTRAIELAVAALEAFHAQGFTHGDAMAENVMVDLEAAVARWFDFETVHDEQRTLLWRRSDDLRALLVTCLLRTNRDKVPAAARFMLGCYQDDGVKRALAEHFPPVWRRSLTFHLGQAPLTFREYRSLQRAVAAD